MKPRHNFVYAGMVVNVIGVLGCIFLDDGTDGLLIFIAGVIMICAGVIIEAINER